MADFSASERFDWGWRIALAHSFTIVILILGLVSFSVPYAGQVKPTFLLMVIYYWAIYRPALIPPFFALSLGFLHDLITGQPVLGLSAFVLLAAQLVVKDQRLFLMSQSFTMVWLGFALTAILAGITEWLLFSLFTFRLSSIMPVMAEGVLGICLFPAIAILLGLIHRVLSAGGK